MSHVGMSHASVLLRHTQTHTQTHLQAVHPTSDNLEIQMIHVTYTQVLTHTLQHAPTHMRARTHTPIEHKGTVSSRTPEIRRFRNSNESCPGPHESDRHVCGCNDGAFISHLRHCLNALLRHCLACPFVSVCVRECVCTCT